jgi:phosphate transport system permease protein
MSVMGARGAPDAGRLLGSRRSRARLAQSWARILLALCCAAVVTPTVLLVGYLVVRGLPGISWDFLTEMPGLGNKSGGIMPAIVGTLFLMAGTAVTAFPVGVLAGVFLAEYAPKGWVARVARLSIANMAGVPSIVYGLFGLAAFVLLLGLGASLAAASLTLGVMTLPVVITATEESLRQVPASFREASLALGASRWRTTWTVVLPAALPGILTGAVLGIGRAAGETAPILLTGAALYVSGLPQSVYSPFSALPYHLYVIATQVPNIPERMQWGTALVLVALVVGVNATTAMLRARLQNRRRW